MASWVILTGGQTPSPFRRRDPDSGELVDRRFRFSIRAGIEFEQDVGCGINTLVERRQMLMALIKGLYHGYRWEDPKLKESNIEGALQVFVDAGGDMAILFDELVDALNQCGTFGKTRRDDLATAGHDMGSPMNARSADPPQLDPNGSGRMEDVATTDS